jgi:hypothetical protein
MKNEPSEQAAEKQEKWEPIEGIVTAVASAEVAEDRDGLTVTLLFSQIVGGSSSDLRVQFGRVLAYTVYEELMHPWETSQTAPRLEGRWERYIYPLLQIKDSRWMSSLPNCLFVYPDAIHYRFLTLDQVVDVLCTKPPEVDWVAPRQS